jgi:hypothetical protein
MNAVAFRDEDPDDLWGPYREEITRRLNRDRPSRYSKNDQSWMEPTIAFARARMPADEATVLRKVARDEVIRIEKLANRQANAQVKKWARGRAPLFWDHLGPLPFTIDPRDGLRVRFDAARPEDFEEHARHIREDARRRYEAELAVAEGLEWLAARARAEGYERVVLIGDMPVRADGRVDDLGWDDEDDDED